MPDDSTEPWLHLFTSNLRELYISDAIDLLAAQVGSHYRFRYESKYIANHTRALWEKEDGLVGSPTAIHFSLQHPANFHPAAFIPLRRGQVVRTLVEGNTYVVYFRLAEYLPLEDKPDNQAGDRARAVQRYSADLRTLLPGVNPDHAVHATTGVSPLSLVKPTGSAGRDFETQVRYLTPSVPVGQRTYFRIASIETGAGKHVEPDEGGAVVLTAGTDYVLNIAHYHYEPPVEPAKVALTAPESLTIVGDREVVIRSRYDIVPVRLFPPFRENTVRDELAVKTVEPTLGPVVRLPLVIRPAAAFSLVGPSLGFGAASVVAIPPLLASGQNLVARIVFAVVGAGALALGLWWRRSRGLGN